MISDAPKVFAITVVIRARTVEMGHYYGKNHSQACSIRSLADRDNIQLHEPVSLDQRLAELDIELCVHWYNACCTQGMGSRGR